MKASLGYLQFDDSSSNCGTFWNDFLNDSNFDHYQFLEVFKTVVCEEENLQSIFENILHDQQVKVFTTNDSNTVEEHFKVCSKAIKFSRQHPNYLTFVQWRYPPVIDHEDNYITHYIMLFIDTDSQSVIAFDSRGVEYIHGESKHWTAAKKRLIQTFAPLRWQEANYFDLQKLFPEDSFCQTWSIILAFEYIRGPFIFEDKDCAIVDINKFPSKYDHFDRIKKFWKRITKIKMIREAIYYEVYSKTHDTNQERIYHQYFTTLEALVHQSNSKYYNLNNYDYDGTGYTFIEDFLEAIESREFSMLIK